MRQTPEGFVMAPAILRLLAFTIDVAVLVVLNLAIAAPFGLEFQDGRPANTQSLVVPLMIAATYHIGFLSIRSATIGKMAMSIYVCYPDGERLRPDTAILRHIVALIEGLFLVGLLISAVMLFVDPRRRTIHDRVAGTIVLAGQPGKPLKMSDVERSDDRRL